MLPKGSFECCDAGKQMKVLVRSPCSLVDPSCSVRVPRASAKSKVKGVEDDEK